VEIFSNINFNPQVAVGVAANVNTAPVSQGGGGNSGGGNGTFVQAISQSVGNSSNNAQAIIIL
jgi:hypothetical protein